MLPNGLWLQENKPALITPASKAAISKSLCVEIENERRLAAMVCSLENKDECLMCGS